MPTVCPNCNNTIPETAIDCIHCVSEETSSAHPNENASTPIEQIALETDLHLNHAMECIEKEDFQGALRSLKRALVNAADDQMAECCSLRGYVYLKLEDFQRSEADCSEAISRHWSDAQTFAWRAAARGEQNNWPMAFEDLAQACEMAGRNRDQYLELMESYIQTASEYYRNQIVTGNESADLFCDRGWVYLWAGRRTKADRDFQHAINKQPGHSQAALGMARLKLETGSPREALHWSDLALTGNDETTWKALLVRTRAHHAIGNRKEVVKDLKQLKSLASSDIRCRLEIGKLRLSLGENVRTISDMTVLLKMAPGLNEALMIRGEAYQAIQNHSLAIDDYSRYLRQDSDSINARLQRGEAYLATKQFEKATTDFDQSLEIDPICTQAFLGRSRIFIASNQLDKALTECQKAARLDNQNADVFGTLAEIHYKLCDYSRAIEEFCRAENLTTTHAQKANYSYRRGNAYYQLNDLDSALRYFRKAIKWDSSHSGAWVCKAQVCAKQKKWDKAILALEQAISLRPAATVNYLNLGKPIAEKTIRQLSKLQQSGTNSVELFRIRGLAYQFLENHEQAVADFSRSLEMTEDLSVRLRRGRCLILLEKFELGQTDLQQVIANEPDNHLAHFWRSDGYWRSGEIDQAIAEISKATKLHTNDSRYFRLHAELMMAKQQWNKAIRSLEQAIRLDPADAQLFQRRGQAYLATEETGRAIRDFSRGLKLSPNDLEILTLRGRAYITRNEIENALRDFETALALDQQCLEAYCQRGAALAAAGSIEPALIWLTKAMHRFTEPRQLADLLFQRGQIFYKMGRPARAINDYTQSLDRSRADRAMVYNIRIARSAALACEKKWTDVISDLQRALKYSPENIDILEAIKWIRTTDHSGPKPKLLASPTTTIRPLKPPQVRQPLEVKATPELDITPPHDMWLVRTGDKKEYGPSTLETLVHWIGEGRLDTNAQILRSDWTKWKRVEKIFPELGTQKSDESFPDLQIQVTKKQPEDVNIDT